VLWPERSHRIINGCRQDLGGGKQTFATLVACRIHQRPAVVQQRVAGHGGPGRPAVAGDGLLGRLARLLDGSRGSVKVSSKVGYLWVWLPGRGLVVRRGAEGAGGAKLERDVVGGVCGVGGRDVVGVVVFGAARRGHGARRCEKDSEMPIAACRRRGDENRTDIYIAAVSLSRPRIPPLQPWADARSKSSPSRFVSLLSRPASPSPAPQHERNRSVTFLKVRTPVSLSLASSLTPLPAQERPVQKGVRTRRPLLRRRRRHRLRQQAGRLSSLPVRL
jgi:hypothetical protein